MKILRSVTRRGFSVGTAGWFTVLRPNTWFPASRLPVGFRYHESQTAVLPGRREQASVAPRILVLSAPSRGLMRRAAVFVAAVAMTCVLLWWIMHP